MITYLLENVHGDMKYMVYGRIVIYILIIIIIVVITLAIIATLILILILIFVITVLKRRNSTRQKLESGLIKNADIVV